MSDMKTLFKTRYARIAGLALGAVAVAGAAVVVTASAAGLSFGPRPAASTQAAAETAAVPDSAARSAVCSDFMSHFAVEIGKSQAQIDAAFQKAIADTLADEVGKGTLTQAQADAIKARLANQTPCTLPANVSPRGGARSAIGAYLQAYEKAAAAALGITPAELQTDLKSGQSLSQIAAAHNVTEADFRTKLIANLQPTLDAAVAAKQLTPAQEQAIVNRLKTGELPLWNRPAPHPKAPTATPTPTNA